MEKVAILWGKQIFVYIDVEFAKKFILIRPNFQFLLTGLNSKRNTVAHTTQDSPNLQNSLFMQLCEQKVYVFS